MLYHCKQLDYCLVHLQKRIKMGIILIGKIKRIAGKNNGKF